MAEDSSELSSPPAATGVTSPDSSQKPTKPDGEVVKPAAKPKKRAAEETTVSAKRTKRSTQASKPSYAEESETEGQEATEAPPKRRGKAQVVSKSVPKKEEVEVKTEVDTGVPSEATAKKPTRKTKAKAKTSVTEEVKQEEQEGEDEKVVTKTTRKRKTKEEKEAEAMPLAARSAGHALSIGAHVSSAGGVHNSVANCVHIGGNAFALFLKSQRKWANPPLKPEQATMFKAHCDGHKYDGNKHIVPHGSYLVNLAHTDAARTKQAYDAFLDDLNRCHNLGIKLYNFHPGNAASSTREEALTHLAAQLNAAHADPASGTVITLLETMAAFSNNTIGGTFAELKSIIDLVDKKDRVGVCLDTCHVFAAGYDLRSPAAFRATIDAFDATIGLKYLKALHINDSKAPLASGRDLHANIGTGFLGLRAFHNIMNEPRLRGLPMVLETPIDVPNPDQGDTKKTTVEDKGIWAREIKLLESLMGMDAEGEEFKKLESELWESGSAERERVQDQVDRKEQKETEKKEKAEKKGAKAKAKGGKKGAKAKKEESSAESGGESTGEEA